MSSIPRFKNIPVYIEGPLQDDEADPVQDIKLPEKSIMDLEHLNPFDEEVQNLNTLE
jgi:hypothetical protein